MRDELSEKEIERILQELSRRKSSPADEERLAVAALRSPGLRGRVFAILESEFALRRAASARSSKAASHGFLTAAAAVFIAVGGWLYFHPAQGERAVFAERNSLGDCTFQATRIQTSSLGMCDALAVKGNSGLLARLNPNSDLRIVDGNIKLMMGQAYFSTSKGRPVLHTPYGRIHFLGTSIVATVSKTGMQVQILKGAVRMVPDQGSKCSQVRKAAGWILAWSRKLPQHCIQASKIPEAGRKRLVRLGAGLQHPYQPQVARGALTRGLGQTSGQANAQRIVIRMRSGRTVTFHGYVLQLGERHLTLLRAEGNIVHIPRASIASIRSERR